MHLFDRYTFARFLVQWSRIGYVPVLLTMGLAGCSSSAKSLNTFDSSQHSSQQRSHAEADAPLSPQQVSRQRMRQNFGNIGAELRVDAMAGQDFYGVEFFSEGSDWPFYAKSHVALKNRSVMSMPLEIPERMTVVWRESADNPVGGKYGKITYLDRIIGTETIDVGSRIPQEVLDSIHKEGGGLRLKFRLSNDGVYFGWDIERRPGYDPNKRDPVNNMPYHARPVFFMVGGDFREAEIFNGKPIRNGWYIDKKTGKKIETDF